MSPHRLLLRVAGLSAVLLTLSCHQTPAPATPGPSLAEFEITVRRTETGVTLTCSRGCAWTELSMGGMGADAHGVDQFGMTEH
jgi:hypothetical protein